MRKRRTDVTGVELGPDYLVLVRAARRGPLTTVSSATTIGADDWPHDPIDRVEMLRAIRVNEHLPSRARAVEWRSIDPRSGFDQSSFGSLLADAGFVIEGTQTPGQALAQLVRDRHLQTDRRTVAAIALNYDGAVIAIVSDGVVISSRTVKWTLGRPFGGSYSELLDRYLLVSQLAPQLEHVIELVRPVYGVDVGSAVLCGNLPNLRSLSMLLIEELDIEVETLDADELLDASEDANSGFAESVSALQLAAAASVADPSPPARLPGSAREAAPARQSAVLMRSAIGIAAFALATAWTIAQLSGSSSSRAIPILPEGVRPAAAQPAAPDLRAEATMGRVAREAALDPVPELPAPAAAPASERDRPAPAQESVQRPRPDPAAAPMPLPRVDGVIIGGQRRLAIVDGRVVGPGDAVGERSVVRIESDGVTLRERSGREVFVPLRARRREAPAP